MLTRAQENVQSQFTEILLQFQGAINFLSRAHNPTLISRVAQPQFVLSLPKIIIIRSLLYPNSVLLTPLMEGVGGRLGRSSSRYGTTTVFTGPVRRWKKTWVNVPPSNSAHHTPAANGTNASSRISLYKWTPITPGDNKDDDDPNGDEIPKKKFKYIPVISTFSRFLASNLFSLCFCQNLCLVLMNLVQN